MIASDDRAEEGAVEPRRQRATAALEAERQATVVGEFEAFWSRVKDLEFKPLSTKSGHAFQVIAVRPASVTIRQDMSGDLRKILRPELEGAWRLSRKGKMVSADDLKRERISESNPGYVVAIVDRTA